MLTVVQNPSKKPQKTDGFVTGYEKGGEGYDYTHQVLLRHTAEHSALRHTGLCRTGLVNVPLRKTPA